MAYLIPHSSLKIGVYTFPGIHSIKIKRSVRTLGDTAILNVPTTFIQKQNQQPPTHVEIAKTIKVGDFMDIKLGYSNGFNQDSIGDLPYIQNPDNYKLNHEFKGFVKRINYKTPIEVECEDWLWLLRRKNIKKTYIKTTLKAVITDLLNEDFDGYTLKMHPDSQDVTIDKLMIAGKDGGEIDKATALQTIKDKYGISMYFDFDGQLWFGMYYGQTLGTVNHRLRWNVYESKDLKYRLASEVAVKIKAVYFNKSGEKTEVSVGKEGGVIRTIFLFDVKDKKDIEKLAYQELKKNSYDGYEGKIKTKLLPYTQPAMISHLVDPIYNDRDGDYFIESTECELDTNGGRRIIEIGIKVNK